MKIPIAALGSPAVAEEHSMPAPQICGTNPIIDTPILLVDLFAGCGGLGEGFATFESRPGQRPFQIIASVEKEPSACRTLRLRGFYRRLAQAGDPGALAGYYAYVRGEQKTPVTPDSDLARVAWQQAGEETLECILGDPGTGSVLRTLIHRAQTSADKPLVLIGGPPCQAYSSALSRCKNTTLKINKLNLTSNTLLSQTRC